MPGISLSRCIGQPSKTIDVMFAGISMFWARLWLILARAIRWGLKWALRRAKDIFRCQKTKKNCVVCFKRAQRPFKNWKVRSLDILAESLGRNIYQWEQYWRSGESSGLPPMWPGFDFQNCTSYADWVCRFSTLLREVFARVLGFSPLTKNQHLIWFNLRWFDFLSLQLVEPLLG